MGQCTTPVSLAWLRYLSAGFKSEDAFTQIKKARLRPRLLYTESQLRTSRAKLERPGFIHSYYDGHSRWYSHRITSGQIEDARLKGKEAQLRADIKELIVRADAKRRIADLERQLEEAKQVAKRHRWNINPN